MNGPVRDTLLAGLGASLNLGLRFVFYRADGQPSQWQAARHPIRLPVWALLILSENTVGLKPIARPVKIRMIMGLIRSFLFPALVFT